MVISSHRKIGHGHIDASQEVAARFLTGCRILDSWGKCCFKGNTVKFLSWHGDC